jgi:hypothetical protein
LLDAACAWPASVRAAATIAMTAAERRWPLDWMWDELDMAAPSEAAQTALQRGTNASPTRPTAVGIRNACRYTVDRLADAMAPAVATG